MACPWSAGGAGPGLVKGSLNLAGFSVDSSSPPTFANFFAASPAHAGQAVFRLQPSGLWERVASPASTPMRSGEAFWIFTSAASTFNGPVGVGLEQAAGVEFGRTLPETVVRLKNSSTAAKTFLLSPADSEQAPDFTFPAVAGRVPLAYWKQNLAAGQYGWQPLEGAIPLTLAAGEEAKLRVAVRRPDMTPYRTVAGPTDYQYQSLLLVTDQAGGRAVIPITARGGQAIAGAPVPPGAPPPPPDTAARAGLWVGTAVIRAVSQPANAADPLTPRPTGSEAQFRVIVHVNQSGQARLLQQVTLMWTNGVSDTQGNILRPGHRVLVTDDSLLGKFTGSSLRDGQPVGRRISTVAFSHPRPITMSGVFGDPTAPLACSVLTGYDDPLNPFKHRFHPDHDNLDETRSKILAEGVESFSLNRSVTFRFTDADPEGLGTSQWGDNQLGGEYTETITGLHRAPIVIRGIFRLNRVSLIPFLDNEG